MATLRDVAAAVGVSHTTVSNAYHRPEKLSGALRERILRTARELGYPGPNPLAAGLATRRAGAVGVLFTEALSYAFTDPAAVLFLQGVAGTSELADVGLTLIPAPPESPSAGEWASDAVRRAVVDGFLAYSLSDDHPGVVAARARGLPLVVVDEPEPRPGDGVPFVYVDDRDGARQAAAHLAGLGHRRVAVLADRLAADGRSGPADGARLGAVTYAVVRHRLAGYLDALPAGSRPPVVECGGNSAELGRAAALGLLAGPPEERPTAILAITDRLAEGALAAARELGVAVPGELSVVGFDDLPPAAAAVPPLTTVRQPLVRKGEVAARMLLDLIAGAAPGAGGAPERVRLPAELVVRSTTAPPAR
ncbi:LacI family DNA-binding transcriptional regulator [Actinomadura fibrosa]|uniref:LacI family DNA-binding transcriptional regulator n=1 Tax=Actinomadura fibrosa TaxID=111802 RepID=A0ABW2XVH0_9ACTN|nr:LacI family DNA-binding transcriptional regulator [Actinomadura fibrosa]